MDQPSNDQCNESFLLQQQWGSRAEATDTIAANEV
jgi:hypothetical protein